MNKRGMEFTITTLLVIVLGILILAILAMGVGFGFGNLWERVTGYFSGSSNVDVIKDACSYACTSQAQNAWCIDKREMRWEKDNKVLLTCEEWAKIGVSGVMPQKIPACSSISCAVNDLAGGNTNGGSGTVGNTQSVVKGASVAITLPDDASIYGDLV